MTTFATLPVVLKMAKRGLHSHERRHKYDLTEESSLQTVHNSYTRSVTIKLMMDS